MSVEVRRGTASFRVSVQAGSIRRAQAIVESWYPGGDVRVVFPIDPEGFFVGSAGDTSELVEVESARALAG